MVKVPSALSADTAADCMSDPSVVVIIITITIIIGIIIVIIIVIIFIPLVFFSTYMSEFIQTYL